MLPQRRLASGRRGGFVEHVWGAGQLLLCGNEVGAVAPPHQVAIPHGQQPYADVIQVGRAQLIRLISKGEEWKTPVRSGNLLDLKSQSSERGTCLGPGESAPPLEVVQGRRSIGA